MATGTVKHLLQPLQKWLDDKKIIEIKANRPKEIWVEDRRGTWKRHCVPALTAGWWKNLAHAVSISTSQAFSDRLPMIKAKLPGGHRLFLMLGSNVIDPDGHGGGVVASIRLLRRGTVGFEDFGLDGEQVEVLRAAVRDRENILVTGGTGSGKTTLTNLLCDSIADEAPVYIEDTEELTAKQAVAFRLLVSPATADTDVEYRHVLDALTRMTPQRIVIGEMTVENAFITLRTLNMGLDGMITTLHADSAEDAIPALAELVSLKGYDSPNMQRFFNRKFGVCVHCARAGDRRLVTEIVRPGVDGATAIWRRADVSQVA